MDRRDGHVMIFDHLHPEKGGRLAAEVLQGWREHGYRTEERLGTILEDRARAWPGRTAVITPSRTLSFQDLQRVASSVARTLVAGGVTPGDVVCWMLPTDAEAVSVASGIWRIGAVSSPIVPIYGPHEMAEVIGQVRPTAVITSDHLQGRALADEFDEVFRASGHVPPVRLLVDGTAPGWRSATGAGHGSLPSTIRPAAAHEPSLILFTSGTESAPKGAVHSTASLSHELRSCISEWGLTFRDRMFMASPMTHITGLLQGFLIPARVGGASVLMDRWDPQTAVDLIESSRATYMAGATPFLRELVDAYVSAGRAESSLTQYCCGGAAVPPQLIVRAEELGIAAYRAWGMTEVPTATVQNELDPLSTRAHTDGRPAPGVQLRVLGDDGQVLGADEEGVIEVRAPEMFLGYVRPEVDEGAVSLDGWFNTGDVGVIDAAGYLRVTGRVKDIINRGGEKFSAREIEDLIAQHPDVASVAVVAVPGGRLGERVGALVVSRSGSLSLEELATFLHTCGVARQKRPELLLRGDRVPLNATGKIDRRAVLAQFIASDETAGEADADERRSG